MWKIYIFVLFIISFIFSDIYILFANNTFDYRDFYWKSMKIIPESYQDNYWYEIFFLKDNPKYGFVCGNNSSFAKTDDSGKTWVASRICTEYFHAECVYFANQDVGYVSGVEGIFKTIDGGKKWKKLSLPFLSTASTWGHYIIGPNDIWLVAGDCYTGVQYILKSVDGGNTWRDTSFVIYNSHLIDIIIYDKDGLGYIIGSGIILRTLDGGKHWEKFADTPNFYGSQYNWHEDMNIYDKSFIIPISQYCSGSFDTNGGLAFSKDAGKNWNIVVTPASMFGTYILNDSTGFGCGQDRNVFYTTDAGVSWSKLICGISNNNHLDDLWFVNDTTGFVVGEGIYKLQRKDTTIEITGDTVLCEDGTNPTTTLFASDNFSSYDWYKVLDNENVLIKSTSSNKLSDVDSGTYFVVGIIFGCEQVVSKSIQVKYYPEFKAKVEFDKQYYCQNDTAYVWFEANNPIRSFNWFDNSKEDTIKIYKSGNYWITLIDTNGCNITVEFTINFLEMEVPELELKGKQRICDGEKSLILLKNADSYEEIIWFLDGQVIDKNVSQIYASTTGFYYVYVSNKGAYCKMYSDSIYIELAFEKNVLEFDFDNDSLFLIDSVRFPEIGCKNIKIYNKGEKEIKLHNVILAKKVSFSLPLSQFPIIIPSKQYKELTICYSPQSLENEYDTLIFMDFCSSHRIPIMSAGKSRYDSTTSSCDVPIAIKTKNIFSTFTIDIPVPNPTSSKTFISYRIFLNKDEEFYDELIFIQLFNILGEEIKGKLTNKNINVDIEKLNNGNIINGQLEISTCNLPSGIYFLKVNCKHSSYIVNLIINN